MMRGDVYDGRSFIKSSMAGPSRAEGQERQAPISISTSGSASVAGHPRRDDARPRLQACRAAAAASARFSLNAKIGRDTPLIGEMRARVSSGRTVLYFETNDAGALFRFTDIYPRMFGGKMWIGDGPADRRTMRRRTASSTSATSRCAARQRSIASRPERADERRRASSGVEFSRMRVPNSPARPAA